MDNWGLTEILFNVIFFTVLGVLGISALFLLGFCWNHYDVWAQGKKGEAQVQHAEWSRQIVTIEAHAKKESAKELAEAEIIRAKGVAEANKIIGDSLKSNEAYLKYLWIQNLDKEHNKVIYVPTEANLPILEAGRLSHQSK